MFRAQRGATTWLQLQVKQEKALGAKAPASRQLQRPEHKRGFQACFDDVNLPTLLAEVADLGPLPSTGGRTNAVLRIQRESESDQLLICTASNTQAPLLQQAQPLLTCA